MNNMEIFENKEFGNIRIIEEGDKYLFCGKDIAKALGYGNATKAIRDHCRTDGGPNRYPIVDALGRTQKAVFLTEGNVYRLISHSKLPSAERFEKWVFDEVLPTIRKHGAYATDNVLNNPELWEKVMETLSQERLNRLALETENEQQKEVIAGLLPKAAYYEAILKSRNAVPITLFAKDYGMSATRFNRLLHALDVQYKVGGCWMLYQRYSGLGFTVTHTYCVNESTCSMQTCWTQKGRLFLYELLSEHGVLPIIELP